MTAALIFTLIVANTVLALLYGISRQNQPANERNLARDDDDHKEELQPL